MPLHAIKTTIWRVLRIHSLAFDEVCPEKNTRWRHKLFSLQFSQILSILSMYHPFIDTRKTRNICMDIIWIFEGSEQRRNNDISRFYCRLIVAHFLLQMAPPVENYERSAGVNFPPKFTCFGTSYRLAMQWWPRSKVKEAIGSIFISIKQL